METSTNAKAASPPLPLFVVDAFTPRPFGGNPAAVCLLDRERDEEWMQLVARDMNLSETAFVSPRDDGDFGLRWFTPAVEVDLCGHATLASAHTLWEAKRVERSASIRFHTRSGVLVATRDGEGAGIALDFPAFTPEESPAPAGLEAALGCGRPTWAGTTRDCLFVQLATEAELRGLTPDFAALARLEARATIVTARTEPGSPYDFVSRFFAPRVGINEDPVTGAAHCSLSTFWSARLGKSALVGFQASARGGVVHVRQDGKRIRLGGEAVTITRGELLV